MTGFEASHVCAKFSQTYFEVLILEPLLNHHFINHHLRVPDSELCPLPKIILMNAIMMWLELDYPSPFFTWLENAALLVGRESYPALFISPFVVLRVCFVCFESFF